MSLSFNPLSEVDILNLLPEDEYDFVVKNADNHRSMKTGNQSIKLTLGVYDKAGRENTVFCYLSPNFMFLLKHFCDSVGLEESYEKGILNPAICVNRSGRCKILIEEPEVGTNYMPKNVVKDFIKSTKNATVKTEEVDTFQDADIPF